MVTAAEVLTAVRKRRLLCESVEVDPPVTMTHVLARFEASVGQRSDLGLLNRAGNLLLESRNPFESSRRRKPKMETTIFGTLFVLLIAALLFFNLAAPKAQVHP